MIATVLITTLCCWLSRGLAGALRLLNYMNEIGGSRLIDILIRSCGVFILVTIAGPVGFGVVTTLTQDER